MPRWFAIDPADAGFLTTAPEIHRYAVRLSASPAQVWESLQSDRSLAAWGPSVKAVRWTSPRPFGVGTTREVTLVGGLATVREEFFRWDEGRGYSFRGVAADRPLFQRFAEDYVVEADGSGALLTWTVAIEPFRRLAPVLRFAGPVNELAFGSMARSAKSYFGALAS